jgi:hypothetical protein
MKRKLCVLAAAGLLVALPLLAGSENINYEDLNKIKAEGMQRSQVMELNSWLSDVYAPRLTGSPMIVKAAEWAMGKMKEWGLTNVKMEPWGNRNSFDRGWTNDKFYMQCTAPDRFPVPGTPTAWTPGTNGLVSGDVVLVTATTAEDLAQYKGKLKGKWILTQAAPDVPAMWDAQARRYTAQELEEMEGPARQTEFGVLAPGAARQGGAPAAAPGQQGQRAGAPPAGQQAAQQGQRAGGPPAGQPAQPQPPAGGRGGGGASARNEFFLAEGVLGLISTAPRGHGMYTIGGTRTNDPAKTLPAIAIAAEQYGRMARALAKNVTVTIEADIKNTFHPDPSLFNVVGEIPGTDKADEVVLLGAHFDTWHAATGAADDGNGSAAMMEAMRILKATGVKLRRTVRIGLWEAEEQGLIGSREYVNAHYVNRPQAAGGAGAGGRGGAPAAGAGAGGRGGAPAPLELKPEHAKFSVYFNIDNGTGALRGIYTQGNEAVVPVFREWIEPFRSLGMTTVTTRNTGGTDHTNFDSVGLPGFQFIQDAVEYSTITHHTNMDTYERLQPRDNMQMATIVAGFAYLAANRDQVLPRKPANAPGGRGRGSQQ